MEVEAALAFIDESVLAKTEKPLNDLQRVIFRGAWQGKSYKQIHRDCADRCGLDHLMRNVAPDLWKLLSEVLGVEVAKNQLQGPVEREWQQSRTEKLSTSAMIDKEDDVIPELSSIAWTEKHCPPLAVEKQPTEANMIVFPAELEPQMTEDEVFDNRLASSMNPLDSAGVIRQKMLSGIEVTGDLEAGDAIQEAQTGNSVEQIMATNLKAGGNIKLGNLTQKS